MSKWSVEMPIAGSIHIEVEADDEESAIAAANERMNEEGDCWECLSWEFHDELVTPSGQFHGPLDCAQAVLLEPEGGGENG